MISPPPQLAGPAAEESFDRLRSQPSTARHFRWDKRRPPCLDALRLAAAEGLPEMVGGALEAAACSLRAGLWLPLGMGV